MYMGEVWVNCTHNINLFETIQLKEKVYLVTDFKPLQIWSILFKAQNYFVNTFLYNIQYILQNS